MRQFGYRQTCDDFTIPGGIVIFLMAFRSHCRQGIVKQAHAQRNFYRQTGTYRMNGFVHTHKVSGFVFVAGIV